MIVSVTPWRLEGTPTCRSPNQYQKPRPDQTPAICVGLRCILAEAGRRFDEKWYCELEGHQQKTSYDSGYKDKFGCPQCSKGEAIPSGCVY